MTCGSRKFFQRGSNSDNVIFLVDEGRKDPNAAISGPSSVARETPFKWRLAGVPMMAQH